MSINLSGKEVISTAHVMGIGSSNRLFITLNTKLAHSFLDIFTIERYIVYKLQTYNQW